MLLSRKSFNPTTNLHALRYILAAQAQSGHEQERERERRAKKHTRKIFIYFTSLLPLIGAHTDKGHKAVTVIWPASVDVFDLYYIV